MFQDCVRPIRALGGAPGAVFASLPCTPLAAVARGVPGKVLPHCARQFCSRPPCQVAALSTSWPNMFPPENFTWDPFTDATADIYEPVLPRWAQTKIFRNSKQLQNRKVMTSRLPGRNLARCSRPVVFQAEQHQSKVNRTTWAGRGGDLVLSPTSTYSGLRWPAAPRTNILPASKTFKSSSGALISGLQRKNLIVFLVDGFFQARQDQRKSALACVGRPHLRPKFTRISTPGRRLAGTFSGSSIV